MTKDERETLRQLALKAAETIRLHAQELRDGEDIEFTPQAFDQFAALLRDAAAELGRLEQVREWARPVTAELDGDFGLGYAHAIADLRRLLKGEGRG